MSVIDIIDVLNGMWNVQITDGKHILKSSDLEWLKKQCRSMGDIASLTVTDIEQEDGELIISIEGGEVKNECDY